MITRGDLTSQGPLQKGVYSLTHRCPVWDEAEILCSTRALLVLPKADMLGRAVRPNEGSKYQLCSPHR
jgi:hypothetical protein